MPKPHIIACISDFHCGHSLGLLNPDTAIEQKGQDPKTYALNPVQKYLWRRYETCLDDLAQIAGDDPVTIFLNGDITHGTKYLEAVFAVSIAEQVQIARWCVEEVLRRRKLTIKHLRLLLGTPAHTLDGTSEQMLSDLLAALYPHIDIGISGHGLYNVSVKKVRFDVAHHGPSVGSREWTKPSVARAYALSLMMRAIAKGEPAPNVVIRSHRHRHLWETVRYSGRTTEMVVTPSFCGMNGHGLQITQSLDEQDHGMYVFVVDKKEVRVMPMVETIDLRVKEKLC